MHPEIRSSHVCVTVRVEWKTAHLPTTGCLSLKATECAETVSSTSRWVNHLLLLLLLLLFLSASAFRPAAEQAGVGDQQQHDGLHAAQPKAPRGR